MRRVVMLGGCLLLGALFLAAEDPPEAEKAPPRRYVAVYAPGPKWDPEKPPARQPGIGEHAKYHLGLFQAGKLEQGGPFLDNTGGMSVLLAGDDAEAKRLVDDDPAIQGGLMKLAALHPWHSVDWKSLGK